MDPSSGQHQEMSSHSMENMLVCSKAGGGGVQERKPRPQPDQALKCPRCDSTNTKFCYYNNYSLSQPRYFCKSCRRYWTKGGTLRNVPVGGGCRKNNRRSSSSSSNSCSSSSSKRAQDHQPLNPNANPLALPPNLIYDSNDLTLAFARLQRQTSGHMGYDHHEHEHLSMLGNPSSIHSSPAASSGPPPPHAFLDALRSGFLDTQNTNFLYYGGGYGNGHMVGGGGGGEVENNSSGEMVMPYEDLTNNVHELAVAPMKQELGNGREDNENRILWGFPWQQINGSGSINIMGGEGGGADGGGEFESSSSGARESWINGLGTPWHGLLNSALM